MDGDGNKNRELLSVPMLMRNGEGNPDADNQARGKQILRLQGEGLVPKARNGKNINIQHMVWG